MRAGAIPMRAIDRGRADAGDVTSPVEHYAASIWRPGRFRNEVVFIVFGRSAWAFTQGGEEPWRDGDSEYWPAALRTSQGLSTRAAGAYRHGPACRL